VNSDLYSIEDCRVVTLSVSCYQSIVPESLTPYDSFCRPNLLAQCNVYSTRNNLKVNCNRRASMSEICFFPVLLFINSKSSRSETHNKSLLVLLHSVKLASSTTRGLSFYIPAHLSTSLSLIAAKTKHSVIPLMAIANTYRQ